MIIKTILLVLATLAIFADAWTTYRALKAGRTEGNNWRSFPIRMFGLKGGTYGVAAILSATLWFLNYRYPLSSSNPTFIVSFISIIGIFLFIANMNYKKG